MRISDWSSDVCSSDLRSGDGIGVDVVGLALRSDADRRDDRNNIGMLQRGEDLRVDHGGLADEAQVEHLLDVGIGVARGAGDLLCLDEVAILAGEADGTAAGRIDGADDRLVDGAGEYGSEEETSEEQPSELQ